MSETLERLQTLKAYIPLDLLAPENAFLSILVIFLVVALRYFAIVGAFYFAFWKMRPPGFAKKLHPLAVPTSQKKNEIKWSLISSGIFALSGYLMGVLWQSGLTQIELGLSNRDFWAMPLSFLFVTLVHEIYFYLTHIGMHHPKLFKKTHAVHHSSVNVSPWASFCFHPYEAIVHALFLPMYVMIFPIHPLTIIAYLTFMTLTAVSNHLGLEILVPSFFQKVFISGTHHSYHHRNMKKNFGLYYTFSDKLFKTEGSHK